MANSVCPACSTQFAKILTESFSKNKNFANLSHMQPARGRHTANRNNSDFDQNHAPVRVNLSVNSINNRSRPCAALLPPLYRQSALMHWLIHSCWISVAWRTKCQQAVGPPVQSEALEVEQQRWKLALLSQANPEFRLLRIQQRDLCRDVAPAVLTLVHYRFSCLGAVFVGWVTWLLDKREKQYIMRGWKWST